MLLTFGVINCEYFDELFHLTGKVNIINICYRYDFSALNDVSETAKVARRGARCVRNCLQYRVNFPLLERKKQNYSNFVSAYISRRYISILKIYRNISYVVPTIKKSINITYRLFIVSTSSDSEYLRSKF